MNKLPGHKVFAFALLLAVPAMVEAGPPLICHPFETSGSALLPWGTGPDWNTPAAGYDVRRLPTDLLALLDSDASILTRMENMRRAVIYATRDRTVAEEMLVAVLIRAKGAGATRLALFDAGYLVESYKQAAHLFGRTMTTEDGYAMVLRSIKMGAQLPEMEFAAALMTNGATSALHLKRARAGARAESVLARNIAVVGW